MDIFDFLLAIFAGVISSFVIVGYTYSENERQKLNQLIENVFNEIDHNRRKLPNFTEYLTEVKMEWTRNNKLTWIDHNEISIGYGNYLYNYFRFDAYNLFTGTGLNLYLESEIDYGLKLFYYNCKHFCATTQQIEDQMRVDQKQYANFDILKGFWKIEEEFTTISKVFEENLRFSIENKQKFKIFWIDWHVKRIRKISGCDMEGRLSRMKKFLFPHEMESFGYWVLSLGSFGIIWLGIYLLMNGPLFSFVPLTFSLMNSAGFFMVSFGLALFLFALNRHSAIGSRKQMDEIIRLLRIPRR